MTTNQSTISSKTQNKSNKQQNYAITKELHNQDENITRLPIILQWSSVSSVLFCSLAFLDPRIGHTLDVLSPFISILSHSD